MRKKKTLAETNPYLRDPEMRKRLLFNSAKTSSAVEGIRAPFKQLAKELGIDDKSIKPTRPKKAQAVRRKPRSVGNP
ncbi:MAG: hypothetical protein ACHBNF_02035 [Chromatiales bacterium]